MNVNPPLQDLAGAHTPRAMVNLQLSVVWNPWRIMNSKFCCYGQNRPAVVKLPIIASLHWTSLPARGLELMNTRSSHSTTPIYLFSYSCYRFKWSSWLMFTVDKIKTNIWFRQTYGYTRDLTKHSPPHNHLGKKFGLTLFIRKTTSEPYSVWQKRELDRWWWPWITLNSDSNYAGMSRVRWFRSPFASFSSPNIKIKYCYKISAFSAGGVHNLCFFVPGYTVASVGRSLYRKNIGTLNLSDTRGWLAFIYNNWDMWLTITDRSIHPIAFPKPNNSTNQIAIWAIQIACKRQ